MILRASDRWAAVSPRHERQNVDLCSDDRPRNCVCCPATAGSTPTVCTPAISCSQHAVPGRWAKPAGDAQAAADAWHTRLAAGARAQPASREARAHATATSKRCKGTLNSPEGESVSPFTDLGQAARGAR